jgi:outer membrane receptor protein involved in Fe transport
VEPGTMYGDRRNQLDLRVSKRIRISAGQQLELMGDVYNTLNANPVTEQNNTYGPQWQRPVGILIGRIAKVGAQYKF